ncbi:MAG TPA: DUF2235 domain-containing protein [Sphingomicrobium sp.]|nr:DUF2235 domain-containing protein [Sphingomicrobium sp.]
MAAKKKDSAKPETTTEFRLAPEGSEAPSSEVRTARGKSIFLFADGTGNSSAKLFKTNVWRMYEAIDLGLAGPGNHIQIGYYDNGVGTSSFRPLALLGGILGIGLKANVLRLYGFLCRNYQPNDRIYVFGFSRGAFTIRLLVGLITSQGILQQIGDAGLSYQIRDAYRAFCSELWPNRALARFFARIFRAIRDGLIHVYRTMLGQTQYRDTHRVETDVEFVGVWDTVAAYGGPFAEFTRGIDDWVWSLTMPHYGLSPKVRNARHALCLDDERDAFHPLLWDEYREAILINQGQAKPGRLKQVWFSGVHSDVGGGYPDESLSYISLLWMMDELSPNPAAPEVDFISSFVQRARDLANPYGPLHDSRSGLGAYYRYQPRKIAAMMNPTSIKTLSLRDPEISRGLPEHGLLNQVCVHESVIARIMSGIDNYAPAALPADFEVVPASGPMAKPALTAANRAKFDAAQPQDKLRADHQENAWDLAWSRRLRYFVTVGFTLLLVALPIMKQLDSIEELCSDDRCFAKPMLNSSLFFVPQTIRNFLTPWAEKPLLVMLLLAVIALFIMLGHRSERKFRDEVRHVWRDYLAGTLRSKAPPTRLRRIRQSAPYQRLYFDLKWKIMPAIFGLATVAALIYGSVALVTQILYAGAEPRNAFCADRQDSGGADSVERLPLSTSNPCTDLKVNVKKKTPYEMTLELDQPWGDNGLPADPAGGVTDPPAYMTLLTPFKRVTPANWLQPMTEVRTHEVKGVMRRLLKPLFGPPTDIRVPKLVRKPGSNIYIAKFCPRRDGHLYMTVNDAAPLLVQWLYANNRGSAWVSVKPLPGAACVK